MTTYLNNIKSLSFFDWKSIQHRANWSSDCKITATANHVLWEFQPFMKLKAQRFYGTRNWALNL